jgi:hypothetical protein
MFRAGIALSAIASLFGHRRKRREHLFHIGTSALFAEVLFSTFGSFEELSQSPAITAFILEYWHISLLNKWSGYNTPYHRNNQHSYLPPEMWVSLVNDSGKTRKKTY